MADSTVVRDVAVDAMSRATSDVVLQNGRVAAVVPTGRADVRSADRVVDGRGCTLMTGLVDHHLHLHALAAARKSVRCGPPDVLGPSALSRALSDAPSDAAGWVRGIGYVDSVAGDVDSDGLDRLHAGRPTRVQHRSGARWTLNGAAVRALGLRDADHPGIERRGDGSPTGRLWRADAWLRAALPAAGPPDVGDVGRTLAALGVTEVTDATPNLDARGLTDLVDAAQSARLPQRLHLLGVPLGATVTATDRVSTGPFKVVLADSGLPSLTTLVDTVREARALDRSVAFHCVSREALLLLLAALDDAGARAGDRVEHGGSVPAECLARVAEAGLTVVTQPGFLADRGDDFVAQSDERDLAHLYRCKSLMRNGIALALSSDAPYGPLDPWAIVESAVRRTTRSGAIVSPDERIHRSAALAAYLAPSTSPGGAPRRIEPGAEADLVLLRRNIFDDLTDDATDWTASPPGVAVTWIGGQVAHDDR